MSPFAYLAAVFLALALSGDVAHANGIEATYRVRVLGCDLPVPTQYVVDATSESGLVMMHEEGSGHIQIEKFTGVPERFSLVSERTVGHLTVSEVTIKTEGRALDSIVIIRDQENAVSLVGTAKALVQSFLDACVPGE